MSKSWVIKKKHALKKRVFLVITLNITKKMKTQK